MRCDLWIPRRRSSRTRMTIKTDTGVLTTVAWWTTCERDGSELILSRDMGDGVENLVVATLASEEDAGELLQRFIRRVDYNARTFDANGPDVVEEDGP